MRGTTKEWAYSIFGLSLGMALGSLIQDGASAASMSALFGLVGYFTAHKVEKVSRA